MNENTADAPMSAKKFLRLCLAGTPEQINAAIDACWEDVSSWDENDRKNLERAAEIVPCVRRALNYLKTRVRINEIKKEQDEWFKNHPGADELFEDLSDYA